MEKIDSIQLDRSFCPIMKAVKEIGDKWTLLILRECFLGFKRFDDFQTNLNISKSVLTTKLSNMIDLNLLEKRSYKNEGERTRHEYLLTQKGKDLMKIILSFMEWGNEYLVNEGELTLKVVEKSAQNDIEIAILNQADERLKYRELEMKVVRK